MLELNHLQNDSDLSHKLPNHRCGSSTSTAIIPRAMCRKTRLFPANVEDAEAVMPDEVKHLIPITRSIAKGLGVCSKTHGM